MTEKSGVNMTEKRACIYCSHGSIEFDPEADGDAIITCPVCGLLYTVAVLRWTNALDWELVRLGKHPTITIERTPPQVTFTMRTRL